MKCRGALSVVMIMVALISAVAIVPSAYSKTEPVVSEEVTQQVNINTATAEELQAIKGVGPKLAARIIAYRTENGNYKTIDDLMNVQGIGGSKFEKIKSQVAL